MFVIPCLSNQNSITSEKLGKSEVTIYSTLSGSPYLSQELFAKKLNWLREAKRAVGTRMTLNSLHKRKFSYAMVVDLAKCYDTALLLNSLIFH